IGEPEGTNDKPTATLSIEHPTTKEKITYSLVFLPYKAEFQSIIVGSKIDISSNRIETGVEYTTATHPKSAVYNPKTSGRVTVDIEKTVKDPAKPEITVTVTNKDAIGGPISNTYTFVYNKPAAIKLSSISINNHEIGTDYANNATIETGQPFTTNKDDFTIEVDGKGTENFTLGTRTGTNDKPTATLTIPHPVIPNSSNTYTLVFLPYKAEIDEIELKDGYTAHVNEGTTDIKVDADYSEAVLPVIVTGASERISGTVNLINVVKATDMNNPVVTITVENKDGFEAVTREYRVIYHSPISSRISGVTIGGTTYPVGEGNIIDISARPLPMPAIADITPEYILPDGNQTSRITLNTEAGTGTITVTNPEGKDYDGKNSHEYTLKFAQVNLSRPKGITIWNASNTKALTLKPVFNSKTYTYEANGNRHDENIEDRIKFEWFDGKELKIETATEGDEYAAKEPKLLITVTNPAGGKDYDGEESHTYTFIFNPRTHDNRSVSLGSISVNGTAVPDFDPDVFDYELPYGIVEKDKIAWTLHEYEDHPTDGTVVGVDIDENAAVATIHVSNEISNSDGEDERTYTLHFLPYYSRLEAIVAADGTRIETFEETGEKINVTVPGQIPKKPNTEQEILESLVFPQATAGTISKELTVTMETVTATLTVSNEKPDVDGLKSRTYILKYDAPFYSRLESLKIENVDVPGFNRNTFNYTVDAQMPANPTITPTIIRGSNSAGKAEIKQRSADAEKALVTVVVTNTEPDIDGESSHTYTVQYLLPYFSRLDALTIGGEAVASLPQDNRTPIAYSGIMPASDEAVKELFGYTFKKGSGTPEATVTIDRSTATARITVTNGGQKDIDNRTNHVYIVQFTLPYLSTASSITVDGEEIPDFSPDQHEYTLPGQMPAQDRIEVEASKGNGEPTCKIESDAETATVTITVTNSGDAEGNNASTTTYTLHYDLPYFSRLDALTIGGEAVAGLPQDGKTPIAYSGFMPAGDDAVKELFGYTFKKGSGTPAATVAIDRSTATARITVTNGGQKDLDGKTSHVYIVQFTLPYLSTASSITVNGAEISDFAADKYEYTVSGQMPAEENIAVELSKGNGESTYSIESDAENATVTIAVTNSGDAEGNHASTTTYILHFDLPYFSRLDALTVGKQEFTELPQDGVTPVNYPGLLPDTDDAANKLLSYTFKKGSGNPAARVAFDRSKATATITVTNGGYKDLDGKTSHVYIVQFALPYYSTASSITISGEAIPGFSPAQSDYTVSGQMPASDQIGVQLNQGSGKSTYSIASDAESATVTITVTNSGDSEGNNASTTTYTLHFDLPYFSRLASLKVRGEDVAGFDKDKFEYTLAGALPAQSDIAGTAMQGSGRATVRVARNTADGIATVTVTNSGGNDLDGKNTHTYFLNFDKPVNSRITSISIDGTQVPGFDTDIFSYTLSAQTMPAEGKVTAVSANPNAAISIDYNAAKSIVTIKVTADGIDEDGETSHTYTLTFKKETPKPVGGTTTEYSGKLTIMMMGEDLTGGGQDAKVVIKKAEDGTCTFMLPDFSLDLGDGPASLGDIVVEKVTMTSDGKGGYTYSGDVKGLELAEGSIVADVTLTGTTDAEGNAHMTIKVLWEGIEINVEFNGVRTSEENPNPGPAPAEKWNSFDGTLSIEMAGSYLAENQPATVYITDAANGKCTFKLPDFSIDLDGTELALGDIVVENVDVSEENGITTYSGFVPQMSFLDGEIIADINLKGTVDANGKAKMTIQVLWEGIEINVEFNGDRKSEENPNPGPEPSDEWNDFDGTLSIEMAGSYLAENQPATVY
ncbi:MAG: calycin-like domain-containing protein, partial [Paramuribaculum sp.]|nr:calycin-like domain-containing protein [Paramuribaculum sp.]